MRSITATFLVWLLVASAQQAPPAAQTATTPPAPQQLNGVLTPKGGYTIHVNSQLVIETVIVKDKQGKPVPGLTAKDFVVSEDGKKQDVKICQFQTLDETPTVDEKLDTTTVESQHMEKETRREHLVNLAFTVLLLVTVAGLWIHFR